MRQKLFATVSSGSKISTRLYKKLQGDDWRNENRLYKKGFYPELYFKQKRKKHDVNSASKCKVNSKGEPRKKN